MTGWKEVLKDAHWVADTAYIATNAITPIMKPKNGERIDWQREFNRDLAHLRAPVEHAIAHLKNWKILATGYRGPLTELPLIIHVITKLELY